MMVFYTEVPSCPQKLWSMLALSKSVPYFFMNSQVDECNFFFTIFFPNLAGLKLARLNIVLVSWIYVLPPKRYIGLWMILDQSFFFAKSEKRYAKVCLSKWLWFSFLFHWSPQKSVPFLAEDLLPSENARTTKSGGQSICSKLVGMLQVNYGPSSAAKIGIESIAVFETYFFPFFIKRPFLKIFHLPISLPFFSIKRKSNKE